MNIGIVDVGFGNIKAIANQCEYLSFKTKSIILPKDLTDDVTHLILPGVGSFDFGMEQLRKSRMDVAIQNFSKVHQRPVLGICLGMHLLGNKSEEGSSNGLGLIDAFIRKIVIPDNGKLRLPHIGWRNLNIERPSRLFPEISQKTRTYFTHSYYFEPKNRDVVTSKVNYGKQICSSFESENIFGVQFHPEKSHKFGVAILNRFCQL